MYGLMKLIRKCGKMIEIVNRVLLNVYRNGVCGEQQESKEGGVGFMDGVGMGEGEGEQNVSNEIEYEEQLLGDRQEQIEQQ